MIDETLKWLSDWYMMNCNGDWEHNYGVIIETIDNPGWHITIDTEDSVVKLNDIPWKFIERDKKDWYGYKLQEGKFEASGDPSKLDYLINLFREIIEDKK